MYSGIAQGLRGKPMSPASARRVHACLRPALNTAVKRRLLLHNPALHIELAPERPKCPEPWSVEECRQFLEAVAEDRQALLYRLPLVTGMRRGEAIGLRWSDVDLARGDVRINRQITAVGGKATVSTQKTRRSARGVPLDDDTIARLRGHRDTQHTERAT